MDRLIDFVEVHVVYDCNILLYWHPTSFFELIALRGCHPDEGENLY